MTHLFANLRLLLLAACCAATAAAQQAAPARFAVRCTKGATSFRPALRAFAENVQREFHSSVGFPLAASGAPELVLEIGFARPFALAAGHHLFRLPSGRIRAVVTVPDPDVADWDALRFAIVAALFRAELHARAAPGARVTEPPAWFVRGLAEQTDVAARGRAFARAHAFWAHGRLDGACWLFRADAPASALPGVAAQLAAWCADRPARRRRWSDLLDALAAGEAWSPALVGRVFADTEDPAALDDAFDAWMAARTRRVFTPGTTAGLALDQLRLALTVFPPDMDWDADAGFDGGALLPLSWYAHHPEHPGAAALLRARSARIRTAALGHDAAFRQLCTLYANALETAAGKGWFYASAYWLAAEDLRADLEARLAAGETLGAEQ